MDSKKTQRNSRKKGGDRGFLAALGIISAIFGLLSHNKEGGNDVIVDEGDCASCTGTNEKCEQTCMMEAATRPVEYFDDEELDRFKGRPSDQFSDWTRSLTLRGIELPDQVKDEAFMLIESQP